MILQLKEKVDIATIEQLIEEDSKFPKPTIKAYFEDVIVIGQSSIIANQIISFLNDYFLAKSHIGFITNNNYLVSVHNKNEKQNNSCVEERNNFTDVETSICFSNIKNKYSFIISYTTLGNVFCFSFQKNYVFDPLKNVPDSKKELSGFIEINAYYTMAFASVVYDYLEKCILDLEISILSTTTH